MSAARHAGRDPGAVPRTEHPWRRQASQDDLSSRMDAMTRRLVEEFSGTHGSVTVLQCVAEARVQLADTSVDALLPMFVSRRAREVLHSKPAASPVG